MAGHFIQHIDKKVEDKLAKVLTKNKTLRKWQVVNALLAEALKVKPEINIKK